MPLYFFDVYDGIMQLDEDGIECTDLQAARLVAKQLLPDIARDEHSQSTDSHIYAVVVSDADHCSGLHRQPDRDWIMDHPLSRTIGWDMSYWIPTRRPPAAGGFHVSRSVDCSKTKKGSFLPVRCRTMDAMTRT